MRPYHAPAVLCAALLTLASSSGARADDEIPQPESRTVVEPPASPAQQPATAQPAPPPALTAAPAAPRSEIGFTLRSGLAETDRFLFGGSFGGASGWLMAGVSADGVFDVRGSGHHGDGHDDDDWDDYCRWRDGRCVKRADLAVAGYLGVRKKTGPILGGARLRLELAGELGWQWSFVDERVSATSTETVWSTGARAFPIAGVRGQVGLTMFRNATFGLGAYARQGLAGRVCVDTDGGCNKVGGLTAGVYLFGGGDWGLSGR